MQLSARPARLAAKIAAVVIVTGLVLSQVLGGQNARTAPSNAEIRALARDAHLVVGDVPLVVPHVALPDQVSMGAYFSLNRKGAKEEWIRRRDEFRAATSSPGSAPSLDDIRIWVRPYSLNDEFYEQWSKLCDQLTRLWARSVCRDPWAPLTQALPRDFHLADDRRFAESFRYHGSAGGGRLSDSLLAMSLVRGQVSIDCRQDGSSTTKHCLAALPVEKHLVAVWSVWESEQEPAREQAEREGRAIAAFVSYALGQSEDFDALITLACQTRRPGSGASGIPRMPPYPCVD
ncbi:hypothetical protein [Albidovulum salinarum]|uniref:hypothetical protein n=1 Tax=Albidovulum salinarum TaxID=2984153 RepID=UPI0021E0A33B|nr:hypothetical protein [Defluviimonas sp. WL0024]